MFFNLLKCCKGDPNYAIDNVPMVDAQSLPSSNTDTDFEIPISLKDIECHTLQHVANLIKCKFNENKNKDVNEAIQFL